MKSDRGGRIRDRAATIGYLLLLLAFIGTVLVPGYRLASQLSADTAALKLVSEQRSQPEAMATSLAAVRDRLMAGAYVGQAVDDLARSIREFDRALTELQRSAAAHSAQLAGVRGQWSKYRRALEPVAGFKGLPYTDSDAGGSQINGAGRKLLTETREAIRLSRPSTAQLTRDLGVLGTQIEADVVRGSATLRLLMIAGVLFACALVAVVAYFQWLKARQERATLEARTQTQDILRTVKEGLFLLDSDFRIGAAHSAALSALLRRENFAGLTFEDLLRDLVSEKTLATATKYVKLLWGDRANENLIRSINPLSEVEVVFDGEGGRDARYLEFDFHRVKGDQGIRQVLVSVTDVTSRVMMARELKESQASAQVQMDMLLAILQVDGQQLISFLDDAAASLGLVNTVLRVPARDDREFREKIDKMFRELHRIKGEAAALSLGTVEGRAHAFEDLLKELRDRPRLTGKDFLPLVVRLDELLSHMNSIRELAGRLDGVRASALLSTAPPAAPVETAAEAGAKDFTAPMNALAQRIAAAHGKKVRIVAAGLDRVPGDYRKAVRDVVLQFVRNALIHGIEDGETRRGRGKEETGVMQIQFRPRESGYELVFQDDGAGILADRVRETAVRRGTISPEEAQALDAKATLALIFRPGFSTAEIGDKDAGRGVGLDLVWKTVQSLGGKIGVATTPGQYTRFRIILPPETARQGAVA